MLFFQAEDGIRDLVRSRGLGDVYKRQHDVSVVLPQPDRTGRDPMGHLGFAQRQGGAVGALSLIHI